MRMMRSHGICARFAPAALAAVVAVSCSNPPSKAAETSSAPESSQRVGSDDVQRLTFTFDKAVVGARVSVSASGLPAAKEVDLRWATVNGGWVIEDDWRMASRR